MINELDILIWFGLALLMLVLIVGIRLKIQKDLHFYANIIKYADARKNNVSGVRSIIPDNAVDTPAVLPRHTDNLFHEIFESAPECIILQTPDGIIELINHTGLVLLEAEKTGDITGQSIYELIAADYSKAYKEMVSKVFLGQRACLEYEMVTFGGKHRWMSTNAVPLKNGQQKITGLISITRDITKTRLLSQQLETHRNKLQTIIESEPECVKLQDVRGVIVEMNPAGLSMLKADRYDDVVGKVIYDFIVPEYIQEYRDLTEQVFDGGRGSMEFEVVGLKGGRRWLETHAAPLFDNAGNVSALLAITRDIDERKKNEARLYQQQTELARVCRLSTMGEMSSSLAHELNQPLCAVSSYAESARQLNSSDNSTLDELLGKIVTQSQRATQIIQNMREFVRKQTPRPESISASSIINNVIDFIEPDRKRSKVPVRLQIDAELPPVKADRVQIEQVLLNLISNALQAVQGLAEDQRSVMIQVSVQSRDELIFKVCNTGPDIASDVVDELFTPFYTTKSTGLGMGLSISRSIVEAHGGHIWYKNKEGYGPCFCFTLPVVSANE